MNKKNVAVAIVLFMASMSVSFFLFAQSQYHIHETDYKSFFLPPMLDMNPVNNNLLKPAGSVAWMPVLYMPVTENPGGLRSVRYYPGGNEIICGDDAGEAAGRVIRYDLNKQRPVWSVRPFPANPESGYMAIEKISISPDGKYVSAIPYFTLGNDDISFAILNAGTGATLKKIAVKSFLPECSGTRYNKPIMLQPWDARFSRDSRTVFVYFKNQYAVNWASCDVFKDVWIIAFNAATGSKLWQHQVLNRGIPDLGIPEYSCPNRPNIEVSPDGKHVAYGNCQGELVLLDGKTGRESIKIRSYYEVYKKKHHPGYPNVQNFQFDPKNSSKAYCVMSDAGRRPMIAVADLGRKVFEDDLLTGCTGDIARVDLSPDGRMLAAGHDTPVMWDMDHRIITMIRDGYDFQFNPVFQEFLVLHGSGVVLVHRRNNKRLTLNPGWNNTGLHVSYDCDIHVEAQSGEFQYDFNVSDSQERGTNYKELYIRRISERDVGTLFLRPASGTVVVSVTGGRDSSEMNVARYRSRLDRWGRAHPSLAEYGGRAGINEYMKSGLDSAEAFRKDQEEKERAKYDCANYPLPERHKANEELAHGCSQNSWEKSYCHAYAAFKAGADVHHKSQIGEPYFFYPAAYGNIPMLKLFLDNGVNINIADNIGGTALLSAAERNRFDALKYLAEKGAIINVKTVNGLTPVFFAVRVCNLDMVKYLAQRGASVEGENEIFWETPLTQAMLCPDNIKFKIVDYLKSKGARK